MSDTRPDRPGQSTLRFLVDLARDWGMALGVVLVIFVGYTALFGPSVPARGEAPDFTLVDLDGQAVALSSVDADVVVLNFWFTTCPPCRAEIPELAAFAAEHPEVALYGVSTDTDLPRARLARASEQLGVTYPVLHDVRADVARNYGVTVFPTTVVIRDMQIVSAQVGVVDRARLQSMIRAR